MQPDIPRVCSELPDTAEAAHHNRLDAGDDHQGPLFHRLRPVIVTRGEQDEVGAKHLTRGCRVSDSAWRRTEPGRCLLQDRSLRDLVIRSRIASRSGLDPSSS
jgi:hypothetical protein